MNCINHPDVPVAAYCQSCGKALCQECVRSIGGVVYCEACLTARLNNPGPHPGAGIPKSSGATPFVGLPPLDGPNPGLALGLGFIPGVGAMYNGQFVKGFAHVLVFALLCSVAGSHTPLDSIFGLLIPFWIAYQVFDAYQTAKARRDGTPLPNPFGLNDLGHRLGLQQHPEGTVPPFTGGPNAGFRPVSQSGTASNFTSAPYTAGPYAGAPGPENAPGYTPVGGPQDPYAPPVSGFVPPAGSPGVPFAPQSGTFGNAGIPVGAVVLIGLGMLFLLSSLGIFRDEWLGRTWPLVLIGIGAWLVYRRTREVQGGKGL
jgi:hypothetical protein